MTVTHSGVIHFEPDRVVKLGDPGAIRIEAEKTRQAQVIGERTGLFRAPRVLAVDESAGRMELERIHGITPLLHHLRGRGALALVRRVGESLAALHEQTRLPDEMVQPLPPEWGVEGGASVVIHGDLSTQNVQVCAGDGSLVILDYSMSPRLGLPGSVGHYLLDLTWFGRNLFLSSRLLSRSKSRVEATLLMFLDGYLSARGLSLRPTELSALNSRFSELVEQNVRMPTWRKWWYLRRIGRYGVFLQTDRFRDRLASIVTPTNSDATAPDIEVRAC